MSKKIIFLMSLTVLVLLTACMGDSSEPTRLVATATEAVVQATATTTLEPTPTLTATPTETPTPEPTATPVPDTPTPTPTATATLTAAELERLSYPSGEDLIIRNRRLFDDVESFRFEQSLSYSFGSISYTLEYVCEQQGDNYHCLFTFRQTETYGQPVTMTREFIRLGTESWTRENEGAWQNLSAEGSYLIPLREFTFSLLDDFTFESEVVATNTLAGHPVYKVELTPWDEEAFVEALLVLIGGVPIAWQNAEILVDAAVWIGQEDYLTYKEIGDIRIRDGVDSYSVYLQTVYSEYNQYQEITAPTSR